MRTPKLTGLIDQLSSEKDSDGELLASFVAARDERAFAELVRRHGSMVFGVCRRVTGDHHVAEEAFQAVFIVLVAKGANIRPPAAVAAWLHGVAYRTAVRARTTLGRRRRREATMTTLNEPGYSPNPEPEEYAAALAALDEEIARLPEYYRLAVVLCELEGCSRADAAASLNIPEGTLSSRLGKARKLLATRLRKRGIALSSAGLSGAFAQIATATTSQVQLSAAAALVLTPARLPESALSLSRIVLRAMLLDRLKALGLCILVLGVALGCIRVRGESADRRAAGSARTPSPGRLGAVKRASSGGAGGEETETDCEPHPLRWVWSVLVDRPRREGSKGGRRGQANLSPQIRPPLA